MSALKIIKELVRNQTDVSLAMARHLSSLNKNSNYVFSPLSLNRGISMTAAGAGGPCREELLTFLKANSVDDLNKLYSDVISILFSDASPSGGPKVCIANGAWIQEGLPLKPSFKHVVDDVYQAASFRVDFHNQHEEIRSQVNSWAEKHTNGLIKNIVPADSINYLTRVVFANALYFKAAWYEPFDALYTKDYDFNLLDGNSVKAPFMTSTSDKRISTFDNFKVLGLRYEPGLDNARQFSMYIFLPDSVDGLSALVDKLWSETGFLERHLPLVKVSVNKFRLPRFKISYGFKASDTLRELGVKSPFKPGGLTEMVDSPLESQELYVAGIHHKACIEVDEKVTEAAAATESDDEMGFSLYDNEPPVKVDFVADHPFMFVIREDITGVLLFAGHVLNPLEKE